MGCWSLGILQQEGARIQVVDRRAQGFTVSQGPRREAAGPASKEKRAGVGQHRNFPPSLIHSPIHWFLEAVPRDAQRKGGARAAPAGCGRAPGAGGEPGGPGGADGGRPGGAGSAACAGSEWRVAGGGRRVAGGSGGSDRSGSSRSARRPPGPQPRLLRLGRTRLHSDPPPLGAAAAPPAARSAQPPPPLPGRSVSQSVTERAARELRTLAASPEKERRAWGGGGGGGGCPARGRPGAGPAGGPSRCHGECSASLSGPAGRGAGKRCRRSRLHFPGARPRHPGAVRTAEPGAGSRPRPRPGPGLVGPCPAGGRPVFGGRRGLGCTLRPWGPRRRETMRCRAAWGGCGWASQTRHR